MTKDIIDDNFQVVVMGILWYGGNVSKKELGVILILSVVVTYGVAFVDFTFSISKGTIGLPFGFSRFNFLGTETETIMLLLDILFWFLIIWLIWKIMQKIFTKK